ncbi:MAG: transcriptional repressor [Armatimonadetes bacterium]|nr:transcriptional repressor [Armatimonadota bacterium]
MTPQRELVFRLLEGPAGDHPTAEVLHVRARQIMPTLSLKTVYSILGELADLGAVRPLDLGTGSMRYCTSRTRHHHLICRRCGRVRDVHVDVGSLEIPPDERRGFRVQGYEVIFQGVCTECLGRRA